MCIMNTIRPASHYRGALKLAIFDLAGTTVDYGSMAPSAVFVDLFGRHGIRLTDAEARGPMGRHKRDHIAALLALPTVAERWRHATGRVPSDEDTDSLYEEFVPLQTAVLKDHAALIPGVSQTMATLRAQGMRIAVTTGYSRAMADIVLKHAARQGFIPDVSVAGTEVPAGRPAPWMALECARRLGLYPMAACVHIGDTIVDVQSGRHAGMWSLGVAATGNLAAMPLGAWNALDAPTRQQTMRTAADTLLQAGAHGVIESVASAPQALETIREIMAKGGGPNETDGTMNG